MREINNKEIRNFSIIAHIDHGKSTLADRILELTGTIDPKKMVPQFLDSMELEREKGITIKLKTIRMNCHFEGKDFILNLVDTPGHVDFSYEVSRSLAAVEGAILLVDATQGIQAQTLANLELAKNSKIFNSLNQPLIIIPIVNKIDSPLAKIEETVLELANLLEIDPKEVIKISAKEGINIEKVIESIIKKIPPPFVLENKPFRALIFDLQYHSFKGVIALVRVVDGEIKKGEKIKMIATQTIGEVKELGYLTPDFSPAESLKAGEIGFIATGVKEPGKIRVGDTIAKANIETEPLPGYKEPLPIIFASFYPEDPDDFDLLKNALLKLKLNDPSLIFEQERREALGRGFKCGFLGTLHIEIISERLQREFGLKLVISTPSVVYKIIDHKDKEIFIYSSIEWPESIKIKRIEEPWVLVEIISPLSQKGKIIELLKNYKGIYKDSQYLTSERTITIFEMPLRKLVANLYDKVKTISQGYASMNYKFLDYRPADLVKLDFLIAGRKEEALSKIVDREEAFIEGKKVVEKLKEILPPQQFEVAIQAAIGGKIIARETLKARRKDVLAPLYGGDVTRKMKLLEKQKKGKKILKEKGQVEIPPKAFIEVFKI